MSLIPTLSSTLLSLLSILIIYLTLTSYNTINHAAPETNTCLMSWMFPNYVPLRIPEVHMYANRVMQQDPESPSHSTLQHLDLSSHSSKPCIYEFFMYKESRNYNHELHGVPVLFLHGNSGSYKQVRSLGVGTYLNEENLPPFRDPYIADLKQRFGWFTGKDATTGDDAELIDMFSLDFKEELSGLHSDVIERQALYVNDAIHFILNSLYRNTKHKSVIVVAHSMGGLVARLAPMLPNYQQGSINTLITFATPHTGYPVLLEESILNLLTTVNQYWLQNVENPASDISNMAIVSIGSGFRDELIRDDMTRLTGLLPAKNQISLSAYDIPGVRTACDHLSVVWCKQLVHMVSLSLLKLVTHKDNQPHRFTLNLKTRMQIFRQVFIGSRPVALVTGLSDSIPSYDAQNIVENEEVNVQMVFANMSAQVVVPKVGTAIVIDEKSLGGGDEGKRGSDSKEGADGKDGNRSRTDHTNRSQNTGGIFAIDLEQLQNSGADFLAIYTNLQFLEYQVFGELVIGKNEHHKFYDLKEYAEILPHVEKMDNHVEVRSYSPHVAKSVYHLPLEVIVRQYGYKRLYLRVMDDYTPKYRLVVQAYNSRALTHESPLAWWDLVLDAVLQRKTYAPVHTFDSAPGVRTVHFPNLGRHIPYRLRLVPQTTTQQCRNALASSILYVGNNPHQQRVEERWLVNSKEFLVKFSASTSDEQGFSMIIHTDPCWSGFTLEAQVAWDMILSYVAYFQKDHMLSMMFAIGLFLIAIQVQIGFSQSMFNLLREPFMWSMVLIPFMVFAAVLIPKVEHLLTTFVYTDPLTSSIIVPSSLHSSFGLYIAIAFALAWFAWMAVCFVIDALIVVLSWTVFLIPSYLLYQVFASPDRILGALFRVFVLLCAIASYRMHAGICLACVLLAQLAFVSLSRKRNHVRKAFIKLTLLQSVLHTCGTVLWIFDLKHRIETSVLAKFSLQQWVDMLPDAAFANEHWYHVLPFMVSLALFFPTDSPQAFVSTPFYFGAFFMLVFSSTPFHANTQMSVILLSNMILAGTQAWRRKGVDRVENGKKEKEE